MSSYSDDLFEQIVVLLGEVEALLPGLGGGGGGTFSGSITATQVAFGTGTDALAGSNDFTWDDDEKSLYIASAPAISFHDGGVGIVLGGYNGENGFGAFQCGTNGDLGAFTGSGNYGLSFGSISGLGQLLGSRWQIYDFLTNASAVGSDTTDAAALTLDAYDVDDATYRTFGTLTNGNTPSFALSAPAGGSLTGDFSTLAIGGVSVATQTYVNAQGFVTASGAAAFTNKTGNISQWTNDSGYATAASSTAFSNKTGNISQWTNNTGYLTSVTAHNLLSATHGDTLAASVVRGDILYGNNTPAWARLAKPSVLSGLSHDGTDVSWVTATGTGAPVRAAGATLSTPTLGVAIVTSLNGNTFTAGTYTLTGVAGKTLTFSNSVTLAGTDATTMTFPTTSATLARTDASNTFTSAQTVTGGTVVVSTPVVNVTQTWNDGAVTFTAIKCNATSTASAAPSLLLDLQLAGVSQLSVRKDGLITTNTGVITSSGSSVSWASRGGVAFPGDGQLQFFTNGFSANVIFAADAAGVCAQRNGTTAQADRIYNTFTTVLTVGEWWKTDWKTTANQLRFGTCMGTSTGTARVSSWDYGALEASPTAAITVPATSGNIVFGGGVQLSAAATTGLSAGALAATTNASIVLYDSGGQAYRVPCII